MAMEFIRHTVDAPHNVYMDETEKDGIIGVAGLVGTFNNWIDFENRWRKALPQEANNDFHSTDFWARHSYGAEWPNEKRLEHIKELARIIGDCTAFAVGFVFSKVMYEKLIPPEDKQVLISPFHFCLAQCLVGIIDFYKDISPQPPKPMRVMFDRKDEQKATIGKVYYNVKGLFDVDEILGNLSLGERKQEPPLQAADLLIGELRRKQEGYKSEIIPILFKKSPLFYVFPTEDEFTQHVQKVRERIEHKKR